MYRDMMGPAQSKRQHTARLFQTNLISITERKNFKTHSPNHRRYETTAVATAQFVDLEVG